MQRYWIWLLVILEAQHCHLDGLEGYQHQITIAFKPTGFFKGHRLLPRYSAVDCGQENVPIFWFSRQAIVVFLTRHDALDRNVLYLSKKSRETTNEPSFPTPR